MKYWLYTLLVVCWNWYQLIIVAQRDGRGWLNIVLYVMPQFRTRITERRGDAGSHCETLRCNKVPPVSAFTICDMVGMHPNPASINTNAMSSELSIESHTPEFSSRLIISDWLLSPSPISLGRPQQTIITEHNVNPSISITWCHYHNLTPCTSETHYTIP
jgi:hypothetical protein